ncbi:MAG: hypothetical protein L0Z50_12700 [Verrucomicrobiales bacterium]|nr:hypothetical protein [Verrucomicrobiales bacterium]
MKADTLISVRRQEAFPGIAPYAADANRRILCGFGMWFLLLIAAAVLAGCSTASPRAYRTSDAPMRLLTQETNGLRVSVDAILDRQRSQKYFSTATLGKGIVPVFVQVENVSGPGNVLVEKEQFKIAVNADAQGESPLAGDVQHKSIGGGVVAASGLLLLSGPLLIVGSAMVSTADEVRHNFVEKEFRNQSLAPGRSAQGFVYCQMPQRKQPVNVVSISIPVRNIQTDEQVICRFLIQNENASKP